MKRNPLQAGLLGVLAPGTGQLYNGEAQRAIRLVAVLYAILVLGIISMLYIPLRIFTIVLPLLGMVAAAVWVIADAVRTARRMGDQFQPKRYNRWYAYLAWIMLLNFVVTPVVQFMIRRYVSQSFVITSGAMEHTLLKGDYLFTNKLAGKRGQRGQVIIFAWPESRADAGFFIMRAVGLPGDTLEMRNEVAYIGERALTEPYAQRTNHPDAQQQDMLWQRQYLLPAVDSGAYVPTRDTWGPLIVPRGMYFVLGDNRDDSLDSRFRGWVPADDINARAHRLYFSRDPDSKKIRWNRIGKRIE